MIDLTIERSADVLDIASNYAEMEVSSLVSAHMANHDYKWNGDENIRRCDECGNVIPMERVKAINAFECVKCAEDMQKREKLYSNHYKGFT